MKKLYPVLHIAHERLAEALASGGIALDATAGNGHDTLFLAQLVGPRGRVYAFDVQEAAIEATTARLMNHGCLRQVKLVPDSHHQMENHVASEHFGKIGAAIYNLGYLPGSDKSVVTRHETTVKALDITLKLLRRGGVLAVVIYTGHEEGQREKDAIKVWVNRLSRLTHVVEFSPQLPDRVNPPELVVIYKSNPLSYGYRALLRAWKKLRRKKSHAIR